ncbi:MAG: DUF4169 family protein [Pseudomonadota bacterium]
MVEPVNLNKVRKAKARAEKDRRAQENRIKYGRTKAQKKLERATETRKQTELDGNQRD